MYVGILALRYADASLLAPFSYVRLVLAMAGVSVLFGEPPSLLSLLGAAAIVIACLLTSVMPARSFILAPSGRAAPTPD